MKEKYLDFEGKIKGIDEQIDTLVVCGEQRGIDYSHEIKKLMGDRNVKLRKIYSKLSAWQTVEVARHPNRPVMKDYLDGMVRDFREMHGDRRFGDDRAIVCGLGAIDIYKVMVIGNYKGRMIRENSVCNFGCANPEGYRKALVKMKFAEKFGIPIVTLIDTPGAYPGVGAEERGQGQAIAYNLREMSRLKAPIISVLIGEGGSGGALGLCGGANRFGALEHSYYSVISPEGCAGILFRDASKKKEAAEALRLSAREGHKIGAIDDIIDEPLGGAHRDSHGAINEVRKYIVGGIEEFGKINGDELVAQRLEMINKRAGNYSHSKKSGWFSR